MTCGQKPDEADAIIHSFVVMFAMRRLAPETRCLEVEHPGMALFVYFIIDYQS